MLFSKEAAYLESLPPLSPLPTSHSTISLAHCIALIRLAAVDMVIKKGKSCTLEALDR